MKKIRFGPGIISEYKNLFDSCGINKNKVRDIDLIITNFQINLDRYKAVEKECSVPWYFTAVLHQMETSSNFNVHLQNGDPLSARTIHVPMGRPLIGDPPFTWIESTKDLFMLRGLDKWSNWGLSGILFKLEEYNGWGYRIRNVSSPYLWGFSNHYTSGKYISDGKFDPNAVSKSIGVAVILRRLVSKGFIKLPSSSESENNQTIRFDEVEEKEKNSALQLTKHQVFISYAHEDKITAEVICSELERKKIKCWIAPRDISIGEPFAEAIVKAIKASNTILVILSSHSNNSEHVLNEINMAVSSKINMFPVLIENMNLSEQMLYYISRIHYFNAFPDAIENYFGEISQNVSKNIRK